jgi:hypothetical protein
MMRLLRRRFDALRIVLLTTAAVVSGHWPALALFAQSLTPTSQDWFNGSVAQQVATLTQRIDKIENMINAVLVALVINFIVQVISIRRGPERRH